METRLQSLEEELYYGRGSSAPIVGRACPPTARRSEVLSSNDPAKGKPRIEKADPRIKEMVDWLAGRGWVKRGAVFEALKIEDRVGRILKKLSRGRIISDSGKGYKLTAEATDAEIRAAIKEARDRAESETKYADAIERVARRNSRESEAPPLVLDSGQSYKTAAKERYFAPLDNASDEALVQRVFGYEPAHRATVLGEWIAREKTNLEFPTDSPQYKLALKLQDCRVRLLRLMEQQSKAIGAQP